jgi:hypothetical protein
VEIQGKGHLMLYLHIGMPKTGTTALQNFLCTHAPSISKLGVRYLEAGRRRDNGRTTISHNQIVFDLAKGGASQEEFRRDITQEYSSHAADICVVSSEMLYSADPATYAPLFADIPPDELCITFFCRSYDSFVEADYKQRAKNGKAGMGATAFVTQRLDLIRQHPEAFSFSGKVDALRAAFPGVRIAPRLYDRNDLINGNVIDDFFDLVGAPLPAGIIPSDTSNVSLSRVGSEAFGILSRVVGRKTVRQLRRVLPPHPVMQGACDVLEPKERKEIITRLSACDKAFHREFFADRKTLFAAPKPDATASTFRRDTAEQQVALQQACEIVFAAILAPAPKVAQTTAPLPDDQQAARKAIRRAKRRARRAQD